MSAAFFHMIRSISLGVAPAILPVPVELADATRFPDDRAHTSYDADAMHRCWRILAQTDRVLKEFRSRFLGKPNSRALQPRFQPREAADLERVLLDRKKFEDAAALDHLALAADDGADVVGRQPAVLDDRLHAAMTGA